VRCSQGINPAYHQTHGVLIVFANIGKADRKNISKIFNLPPIDSVSISESDRSRIRVAGGNKPGSTFLRFEIPELKVHEKRCAKVAFLRPEKITSLDAWGQKYGYAGSNVLVRRVFLGNEMKVDPSDHTK